MAACGRGQEAGGRSWRVELELESGIVDFCFEVFNAYPRARSASPRSRCPSRGEAQRGF